MFEIVLTAVLIFAARIGDVSFATLRMIAIVNGRRGLAWVLGCCESLIWILAVSRVFGALENPVFIGAWALGYGTGGYVGMTIERWFAFGRQAVRIFTRDGRVAPALRAAGYRVTLFDGQGRDGVVHELFVAVPRKEVNTLIAKARTADASCFYTVEDVRAISEQTTSLLRPSGWRLMLNRR